MVRLVMPRKSSIKISGRSTLKVCFNLYYHKFWPVRQMFRTRLQKTLDMIPSRRYRLSLDIGSGTGIILPTLSKISGQAIALELHDEDKSHFMEMKKKERLSNLKIMGMGYDFQGIKLEDKSSDLIICLSAIEHCKELDLALKEIHRLLSDDGLLVISYPIEEVVTEFIYRLLGLKEVNEHHHYSTYKQIRKAVKKHFIIKKRKKLPFTFLPDIFSSYEILACRKR